MATTDLPPPDASGRGPAGAAAPPAKRRGRWVVPAIAVVVAVVIIVAALFASGILAFSKTPPSNSPFETFSQAEARAASGASSAAGGPWYAVAGSAIVAPIAVLEPTTNLSALTGTTNCTFDWPSGEPQNVAIPASAGAPVGESAYWSIVLKNASNGLLVETVSAGAATTLVRLGGSFCEEIGAVLATFPPGVVDSPAAVSAANSAGGSAFLATYPNATQLWVVFGGLTLEALLTTSPEWIVEDTSCGIPLSAESSGAVFNATIGGTSGAVLNHTQGSVDCALTGLSVGGALALPLPGAPTSVRKAI